MTGQPGYESQLTEGASIVVVVVVVSGEHMPQVA